MKTTIITLLIIAASIFIPYYAGHYAASWLFPYFPEGNPTFADRLLDWVFGIACVTAAIAAYLILYMLYCTIFGKDIELSEGIGSSDSIDISSPLHPLNPANPASPNSLMNPANPASPISPLNPMNQINNIL